MSSPEKEDTENNKLIPSNSDGTKPNSDKLKEVEESDEDSIQELCVINNSIDGSTRETYYDNDLVIDRNKVLERWNVKKCADPNINHSKLNYRLRVFKDSKITKKREFRLGIFFEDEQNFDFIEMLEADEENRIIEKDDAISENPRYDFNSLI